MLVCLKNTHKGLQYGNSFIFRCLGIYPKIKEEVDNSHSQFKKKYAKLPKDRRLQLFNKNFVNDLFLGKIDHEILKYPNIVQNDQSESFLQHISALKLYLNTLSKDKVEINKDVLNSLQKLELTGLTVPQKYGGLEYSETEANFIYEQLGLCPKIFNLVAYNDYFGAKILKLYGTDEQKLKYLPKLANGKSFISLAYLENGPLADLTSLKCSLNKDEKKDWFLINGEKKWVANVNISDLIIVLSKSVIFIDDKPEVKFNLNLIEKNTPGITFREVQSNHNGLLGLYEVKFDNVVALNNSFISSDTQCGISIVKNALSYSNLSASIQCLGMLKKILTYISAYCTNKELGEKILNELSYLPDNIKWLKIYIYALESVTYLVSEWFDEFDKPDLFAESSLTKLLATDILKLGINKYLQTFGFECYKPQSFLEELLQILYHVTVFDENNLYLKPIIGCCGLLHVLKSSPKVKEKIIMYRQPYNYPTETILSAFTTVKSQRNKFQLLEEITEKLHPLLKKEANILWWCVTTLRFAIENSLIKHGNKATENEIFTAALSDMACYVFALGACLSRASMSLYNKKPSSTEETKVVKIFAYEVKAKIMNLEEEITYETSRPFLNERIGNLAFNAKKYPVEHPLAKSY